MLRKYTLSLLLLLMFLLPIFSLAQVLTISRELVWEKPVFTVTGDTVVKNISFQGASITSNRKLPYWAKTFYIDSISDIVALSNCSYLPLTDEEYLLILNSGTTFTSKPLFLAKQVMSRKQKGIYVEISPFIYDSAIQQFLKLASFDLQFSHDTKRSYANGRVYAANSVLSQGNWYKIAVTQTGIHQLEYNDLVAMGITPSSINPSMIGIFGRGGRMLPEVNSVNRADDLPELAIEVTGQSDGSFDPGDKILFYAEGPVTWQYNTSAAMWEHKLHLYADTINYFFSTDRGTGKRVDEIQNSEAPETQTVDSYDFYSSIEENNFNLIRSGKQWFYQIFDVILNRSYTIDVPDLAAGGEVKVKSITAAKSINGSSFGFKIGSQSWTVPHEPVSSQSESSVATGATAYKTLESVTLPLEIDLTYNKTSASAAGYLDLLDINARCELRFTEGQLDFRDSHSTGIEKVALYRLRDAAGKVRLWDVTDLANVHRVQNLVNGQDITFKLNADTIRQFVAFDESKLLKPRFVQKTGNQDLHAFAGADMIILSPQVFIPQAVRLAEFHSSESDLNVLVTDLSVVYNEFSSGTPDVTAIRDFMKMLYDKAPEGKLPRYLLLFGDASYDYKNKIVPNTNFIPSWQSWESFNPVNSIVSDDYFGTLDDNEGYAYSDIIDIGIGRLPVKTIAEAEEAVTKIMNYAIASNENSGDWKNVIAFVADDQDTEHILHSEELAKSIESNHHEINLDKIYLDSYVQIASPVGNRYPDVNKAITQRVEKGCLIINYIGHGGETGWAHEEVLTTNEILNWSNKSNLPVFVTATCEFSRFDDPQRQAAGEMVLTNPIGGGIALFTTTRPTYGSPNFELNKQFFQYAFSTTGNERLRLGDIIMNSKRDKGSNENGRKYVLLGDPALQIAFPSFKVVTTSVNGHIPGSEPDTLKAYMEVTIEGKITDNQGNIISDFNGIVSPSVFDKQITLKTLGNDGGSVFSFLLRKNLLYKGKVNVINGLFSFTFIVPKDIAYRFDAGKISYYASDGTRDATGYYDNVVIGGSTETALSDNTGPQVDLYINDLRFRDGGMTDPNARLLAIVSDENGINTIGNGIGHDITAILDGNSAEPFILNDFYVSDINTFKSGYIWFPFSMLAPGNHQVVVKVWDIFNNSSEAEINFVVNASGQLTISNTYNFPNPFSNYTDIVFEHNQQNVEFAVTVEIFSITGQLVRIIEQTSVENGSVSTPIRWDGTLQRGSIAPPGLYLYNIKVRTSNGLYSQATGKLVFQK